MTGSIITSIVEIFSKNFAHKLRRLHGLIKYALDKTQEDLINTLYNDYASYRLVLLSMDMEQMAAGLPFEDFITQLEKLKAVKQKPAWHDKIFPFVFADPNRTFFGPDAQNITSLVKKYLIDSVAPFQGIKLYPALGYFPFDKKLKEMYQYAVENDVPLLTHCIVGDVHQRCNEYYKKYPLHPISKQSTTPTENYKKPENFQVNFTHPLNFECLLNKDIASKYFEEEVDFSKLKICIGHFGGEEEWMLCKKQEAKSSTTYKNVYAKEPLDIGQQWLGNGTQRYSWLKIIKELIRKYPNVYADISYTLHEEKIYPILKSMLKDETLKYRILFGTDYYVVASESEESELIRIMHKHLTPDEISLISYQNPIRFLSSKLNPIPE